MKKDTGLSVALLTSTERMVLTKAMVSLTTPWTYKQTARIVTTFHLNFYRVILLLFYLQTVKNHVYCAHAYSQHYALIFYPIKSCYSNELNKNQSTLKSGSNLLDKCLNTLYRLMIISCNSPVDSISMCRRPERDHRTDGSLDEKKQWSLEILYSCYWK